MKSFFDKLNLRPQERRLVVIVGMVIFIVLNIWFVWPYFDDWGEVQSRMEKNRQTLAKYNREIGMRGKYNARLEELKKTGSEMLSSELELQRIVQSQATAAGFQIASSNPGSRVGTRTNQFFQEQTLSIQFTTGGKELVDFLVGIAAQDSMIRVREMSLKPDPTQTRLVANMVLVGNYQRRSTNVQRVASALSAGRP